MFVGRDSELHRITTALAEGLPVVVSGRPGVGKSALAERAARTAGEVRIIRGVRGSQRTSLAAFADLLRRHPQASTRSVSAAVMRAVSGAVLVVEDLHWIDDASLEVLAALIGHVPMVGTTRGPTPGVLTRSGDLVEVELHPLSPLDARSMVTATHPDLDPSLADALLEIAAGNPALLRDLPRLEARRVTPQAAVTAASVLASRVDALGPDDRRVLDLLVLLDRPIRAELLSGDEQTAVGRLVDRGLVLDVDDRYVVPTDLLRDAFASGMGVQRRRVVHSWLAQRLDDPVEVVWHLACAGDTAGCRAQAAILSATVDDQQTRGELQLLAAMFAPEEEREREFCVGVASLIHGGVPQRALALLEPLPDGLAPLEIARRAELAASALWSLGAFSRAASWVQLGLHQCAGSGTGVEVRLRAYGAQLDARAALFDTVEVSAASADVTRAEQSGSDVELVETLTRLARIQLYRWDPDWEGSVARAMDHARRAQDWSQWALATELAAGGRCLLGDPSAATTLAREASGHLLQVGAEEAAHGVLTVAVFAEALCAGTPAQVLTDATYLSSVGLSLRNRIWVLVATVLAQVDLGDLAAAERTLELFDELDLIDPVFLALHSWATAEVAFARGRHDEVRNAASRIATLPIGPLPQSLFTALLGAHVEVRDGRPVAGEPPMLPYPAFVGAAFEWQALVLASQDLSAALETFERASEAWAPHNRRCAFRCMTVAAQLAKDAGHPEAPRFSAAADRVATAAGIVTPSRRGARVPVGPYLLTPRQHEVVGLVAKGATSREIAHRLGISVSTVESHIRAVLTITGCATRREAARLITGAVHDAS